MEAPLAKLVKMFKNNVERIGKGLIREAKAPKDFVDIICKHYDDYRLDICFETSYSNFLNIIRLLKRNSIEHVNPIYKFK